MSLLEVEGLAGADMSQLVDLDPTTSLMMQNGFAEASHHS
jgi:hypothetical protein